MNVRHMIVTPCDLLYAHGAIVIELAVGGQLVASVLEVVQLIDKTVREMQIKSPIVVIDGSVPDDRDPEDVLELIQVLKRKGMAVFGKTSGAVFPRWCAECNRVAAIVTNEAWLGYRCDEVQYIPPLEGPLSEPRLEYAHEALKSIQVARKIPPAQLFNFLSEAAYPWQVLSEPKYQYTIVVVKEK